MKLAVIFGVMQMVLGIILKGTNYWFHKKPVDFIFEFLPQLIVMLAMFGFMDYLIVVKWLTPWDPAQAPSIVTTMIGMFLGLGAAQPNIEPVMKTQELQTSVMHILLLFIVLSIPLMLCVKPCYQASQSNAHKSVHVNEEFSNVNDDNFNSMTADKSSDSVMQQDVFNLKENIKACYGTDIGSHGFGELFIHQMIETIEFVLGTVSNTASYLRLWALSLAHS